MIILLKKNLLTALLLLVFAAASAQADNVVLPYAEPSSTVITEDVPSENPVEVGVNPLTGEPWSGKYRPIMVQIDADPNALPHWGVSSADIMYELPLHSAGNTRSVALFMSEIPSIAGPVRSARVPMASLREMWGAAWVFAGTQEDWVRENPLIDVFDFTFTFNDGVRSGGRYRFPFMNGLDMGYSDLFERRSDGNHVAPHNLAVHTSGIPSLFDYYPAMHSFRFTDEPQTRGVDVSGMTLTFKETSPAFISSYQYNPSNGLYTRYREGAPYVDGLNGETCTYANVIVVHTKVEWYNGNGSRPVVRLLGQGTADIFQNGKWIRGTWLRGAQKGETEFLNAADQDSRMVFLDDEGNELEMQRGKTFIQIVDEGILSLSVQTSAHIEGANPVPTQAPSPTPAPTRTPRPTRTPQATRVPEHVAEGTQTYVIVTGDLAKLRDAPKTSGILVSYASKGETFVFLGRASQKWLKIQMADGTIAYVSDGLADVVGEQYYTGN